MDGPVQELGESESRPRGDIARNLKVCLGGEPLVEIVAVFDALSARLAENAGFDAVVVGGGAIANFSYGLPDVGLLSQEEVIAAVRRICETVTIPVILDIDDGGLTTAHVQRSVELAARAGAAGVMLEDVDSRHPKHLWDEQLGNRNFGEDVLRAAAEAADRVSVAVGARTGDDFLIVARTDAYLAHHDGLVEARRRVGLYAERGADMLFIVGLPVSQIGEATRNLSVPVMVSSPRPLPASDKELITASGSVLFYGASVPISAFVAVRDCLAALRSGTDQRDAPDQPSELICMLKALSLPEWSALAKHDNEFEVR